MPAPRLSAMNLPCVRDASLARSTVGEIASAQARVAYRRSGTETDLVPMTPAAKQLLGGTDAARAVRLLRGIDSAAQATGAVLEGVTLTTTRNGLIASTVLDAAEHELVAPARAARRSIRNNPSADEDWAQSTVEDVRSMSDALAFNTGGWITLAPGISRTLLRPDAAASAPGQSVRDAVRTVSHEIEHSVTPSAALLRWEEAIAETLAAWPGRDRSTARELGVTIKANDRSASGYDDDVHELRRLLVLAGINPRIASHEPEARALLQDQPVEEVPARMAQAIASRLGATSLQQQITSELIDNFGDRTLVDRLRKLVK